VSLDADGARQPMTRKIPSTDFVPYALALDHVERREGAPAKRLLDRALAEGLPARGYVIHHWPPYEEGYEQLDPELFTPYPQASPARVERDGSASLSGWAHPHFECRVLNITVDRQGLLRRWPGKLKLPAKSRRPSVQRLVKDFEKSGHRVASVSSTPDGMTIHFGQPEQGEANNPWLDDLKVTKQ
jgi:hypothetical protein